MKQWSADINSFLSVQWMGVARDKRIWNNHAEAYILQWIDKG